MYREYFGLKELPFSIAPDPRYLYMSERHREALAHLLYGVSGQGGFVVLTGEVGTGKTTICRCFLQQVPDNTDVAFIVNPKLSAKELLENICDEFGIAYPALATVKVFNDLISQYLLQGHSNGRHTVLIIDEAQNLRIDVLEQLRLLTNLETSEKKLLQIILLGQPELQEMLARTELRQLAQRVTARYHLKPLSKEEVGAYIRYRLAVGGQKRALFNEASINRIYKQSGGIPRLINLVCDRALLGSYSQNDLEVTPGHIKKAFKEIHGEAAPNSNFGIPKWVLIGSCLGVLLAVLLITVMAKVGLKQPVNTLDAFDSEWTNQQEQVPLGPDGARTIEDIPAALNGESPKVRYGKQYIESLTLVPPPFNSKQASYKAVLKEWGADYSRDKGALICEFAESKGLSCLHKQGNLRSLMEINRPAIMKLHNRQGQEFHIGLLAVEGKYAKIALGNRIAWTSLDAIDKQWYGEYSVIWQLPPYKSRLVRPGEESDENKWLNNNFGKVGAVASGYQTGRPYQESMPLEDKIRWFQKKEGLKADGVVGSRTLIQLNNFIRPNRPLLVRDATQPLQPKS